MYKTDVRSGETIFSHKPVQPTQRVFLISHNDPEMGRVKMEFQDGCWTVRVKLRAALFIYRFEVDGHARWDRDAGKVRFSDGKAWSLAVVSALPLERSPQTHAFA